LYGDAQAFTTHVWTCGTTAALTVRTDLGHSAVSGSVGDYFWAGAAGTYFWIDPQEKLYAVMMLQMPFMEAGPYRRALREIVYGALLH